MTGVDIAAHASEAGGASPLPTGPVETRDHSSPAAAGSFSEAMAAQTDEERPVLVAGFTPDQPPFAVADPGGEPSESEAELTETTGVIPETDVSPTLHDGVTHALLIALVGDSATVGETGEVLPNSVVRVVTPVASTLTVFEGIDDGDPSSQTHVASNRVPTPIESFGPTLSPQPKAVNVTAAEVEGTVTVPQTPSNTAVLSISADPTPAPTPGITGINGSVAEVVTLAVPDAGVDQVPVPTTPGAELLEQSTGTFVKTPTNASSVPDPGRDGSAIRPARVSHPHTNSATTLATGETPVNAVTVTRAQDTQEVEIAFPRDGVAEPTTPARPVVVATPPTLTEPQTSDGPSRPAQAAERLTPSDGKSAASSAPPAAASAVESDVDTPDTFLDEKTTLGRFLGRSEIPVKGKTQQSVTVVGTRQTTPIMVDLPSVDSTSTHPVLSFPGPIGTDHASQ